MGYSVGCLQGNMSQNARDRVMKEFREHKVAILVATNVAARGLDVDRVELVVNYELPENSELLTHRVGRTGRMGREGQAFTLVADTDDKKWRQLKRGLKKVVSTRPWKGSSSKSSNGPSRQSESRASRSKPNQGQGRRRSSKARRN